jgi:hypothetical protein
MSPAKSTYTKNGTQWTRLTGLVVSSSYGPKYQAQSDEGGRYIFSNLEPPVNFPVGTKISFDGGHPGDHRGVAINVKKLKESHD